MATPSVVQTAFSGNSGPGVSSVTFSSATTAGNVLIMVFPRRNAGYAGYTFTGAEMTRWNVAGHSDHPSTASRTSIVLWRYTEGGETVITTGSGASQLVIYEIANLGVFEVESFGASYFDNDSTPAIPTTTPTSGKEAFILAGIYHSPANPNPGPVALSGWTTGGDTGYAMFGNRHRTTTWYQCVSSTSGSYGGLDAGNSGDGTQDGVAWAVSFVKKTDIVNVGNVAYYGRANAGGDPYDNTFWCPPNTKGIIVGIGHSTNGTGTISSVSYGGVTVPSLGIVATDTTETCEGELFFLGSGVPTGSNTLRVDLTSNGSNWFGISVMAIVANDDTEVIDTDSGVSAAATNPAFTLSHSGRHAIDYMAGGVGANSTVTSGVDDDSRYAGGYDPGNATMTSMRSRYPGTSDFTIGIKMANEDYGLVAAAIAQVVGGSPGTADATVIDLSASLLSPSLSAGASLGISPFSASFALNEASAGGSALAQATVQGINLALGYVTAFGGVGFSASPLAIIIGQGDATATGAANISASALLGSLTAGVSSASGQGLHSATVLGVANVLGAHTASGQARAGAAALGLNLAQGTSSLTGAALVAAGLQTLGITIGDNHPVIPATANATTIGLSSAQPSALATGAGRAAALLQAMTGSLPQPTATGAARVAVGVNQITTGVGQIAASGAGRVAASLLGLVVNLLDATAFVRGDDIDGWVSQHTTYKAGGDHRLTIFFRSKDRASISHHQEIDSE